MRKARAFLKSSAGALCLWKVGVPWRIHCAIGPSDGLPDFSEDNGNLKQQRPDDSVLPPKIRSVHLLLRAAGTHR